MSLQDFIQTNQVQLLALTRGKVEKRSGPDRSVDLEKKHGVPIFLGQVREALLQEAQQDPAQRAHADPPTNPDIAETATLHGHHLLRLGFSIDQVVRDYGDVCQAVTELAVQQNAPISVAEFHTLNRCLDNAIAAAVTSWTNDREKALSTTDAPPREHLDEGKLRALVSSAILVFELLQAGKVAAAGSAGALLGKNLSEMRTMLDASLLRTRWDDGQGDTAKALS